MTLTTYTPDICDKVQGLLADGLSRNAVMSELRIPSSTWHDWRHAHPEFEQAVEFGVFAGQARLEKNGRNALWLEKEGPAFNNGMYMFTMKSQYKITDEPAKDAEKAEEALSEAVSKLDEMVSKYDAKYGAE